MERKKAQGKRVIPMKYAVGGAAGVAVLVGAGLAIGFGDIGASLANVPIVDTLVGGIGDAFQEVGEGIGEAGEAVGALCDG